MSESSDIVKFQRWLQSQLSEAENIDDPKEKQRRILRLDAALSETIFFRELLETIDNVIESPFVQRENPVRNTNRQEVTIKQNNSLLCSKCNGEIDAELKFCLLCGEY
ncbi:MAG: hypothetical protein CND89_02625 [Marine Group II euryarchaeote MED-G38]|nr:hypothetical protein [Euryarchaeota archaeon]OUV26128.1 MAG: hypothetical protein CBC57_03365 [Euryarchaeota archaeon TMED97]PDH22959.1 MAG: hypothetical protein CND89_02625 [Marine Group II euryarchaeote MED-G38]|tara:strand:- start:1328 stop:1651 length:324 start_codon:yes stop_codon:yes gene_type:complete